MPRAASSPLTSTRPSTLSALAAASIVAAYDPRWLAQPVAALARSVGERADRISRVKGRMLAGFTELVSRASQRGRPSASPVAAVDLARARAAEALLAVTTRQLAGRGSGGRAQQDELVAAQARLAREHSVDQRRFCAALAISERTFRSWRGRAAAPPQPQAPPPARRPRKRPVRRGRFALEVQPAGVQAMIDTSDWKLFGVPLKVIAVQDPGARGRRTWEASEVATQENAEEIVAVVRRALADRPGTQLVTDQGTPYMAQAAREIYEQMELEHAPQKEGDPLGKATLERSFRSVKDALEPLVSLSERLADALPALCDDALAAGLGRVLVGTFLDVDRRARASSLGGARGPPQDAFAALAQEMREKSRAENRSRRLTLERIHEEYEMPGTRTAFVRRFRRHVVGDILDAERRMGTRACRCQANYCDRYFAAILRKVAGEGAARRSRRRRRALADAEERAKLAEVTATRDHRRAHPEDWIVIGLERIGAQWRAESDGFVLGQRDPVRGELRRACAHLVATDPTSARDRAEVAWSRWHAHHAADLGRGGDHGDAPEGAPDDATRAIRAAFDRTLGEILPDLAPSLPDLARAILRPHTKRHPPPSPRLRI